MNSQGRSNGGLIGRATKGVSGLIGVATELHAHNKAKKAAGQRNGQRNGDLARDGSGPMPPTYDDVMDGDKSLVAQSVEKPITIQPLPYPVILPQRRPNEKTRGFVRAYAPDLGQYKGIDQQAFLTFLKEFHKSSQASPVFGVINIAAMIGGLAPSAIAMAVSTAVMMGSEIGAEAHRRYRTNAYLDKVNEELFHPKNLHCMIMTYKPEARNNMILDVNVENGAVAETSSMLSRPNSFTSSVTNGSNGRSPGKFRKSDGVTEGEFALPQAAQLIFPEPTRYGASPAGSDEDLSTQSSQESSWKSTRKFVSEYKDRRAQAEFAAKHGENSRLAVPGACGSGKFASRFSDPNHPVNSGNPLALLTGGMIGGGGAGDGLRGGLLGGTTADRQRSVSPGDQYGMEMRDQRRQSRQSNPGLIGGLKKMVQQDLLYLLIAEMPPREVMEELVAGKM